MTISFTFSGHESFPCRQFWLKKGYDFLSEGNKFSDDHAIAKLGVGKNMVISIQYWMKCFGLLDENGTSLSKVATYVFGDQGRDPFLEDLGTLWLLHYLLISTGRATVYQLVFNEFRKHRIEFTREQLTTYLVRKCSEAEQNTSFSTLRTDVDVFVRTYLRPTNRSRSPENDFFALLIDLELIQNFVRTKADGGTVYRIESKDRDTLPTEVVLFAILQQNQGLSLSFAKLMAEPNNVGNIFALSRDGLQRHMEEIAKRFTGVTFTEDAGIKELQFTDRPDPYKVLDRYYHG